MKILHIFGAVVAVHLAVFLVIFAVPGCRTTGKPGARGTGAEAPPPLGTEPAAGVAAAQAPADGLVAFAPPTAVRFSPTRPGSPAASAVAAPPVTDVVPASTYVVVSGDSLWTVAKKHGLTVAELAAANGLKPNAPLKIGQKLLIAQKAAAPKAPAASAAAAAAEPDGPVHVVAGGETLGQIARQHGTTVGTLKRLNGLKTDTVRVGQKLMLPTSGTTMPDLAPAAPKPGSGAGARHTVKSGETLGQIAKKYGITPRELAMANHIDDPARIRAGQELVIPGQAAARAAETMPAPAATPPVEAAPSTPAVPAETTPVIRPATEVPVIRIEDTPPPSAEPPRVP